MHPLRSLLREIHRRSVWQVLGVYLAGSWVAYQVIMAITQGVGLPEWVPAFSLVLFLVGLPLVLATAIVQEGHPFEGRGAAPGGDARAAGIVHTSDELLQPSIATARTAPGASADAAPAPASRPGPPRGLTWRRVLVMGAGAFAALAFGTAGYMGLRAAGIGPAGTLLGAGAVQAGDLLVLADFQNTTSDPLLGHAVTRALRVDLHQGRVAGVAEPARVREALGRAGRDPNTPLDEALALEVAEREGLAGVISGEVAQVGAGFSVASQIVATDGRVLAMFREVARSEEDLVDAIERLSRSMRARLGDTYRELYASPPLARVTTGSLEALRLFTEAERMAGAGGLNQRTIELWEEAVAIDPEFAMAHRRLGVAYLGTSRARSRNAYRRAFELRERLTPSERGLAEGDYHARVVGDYPRAIQAYRAALRADPDNDIARNNLVAALIAHGEDAEAEAEALEGLARGPAVSRGSLSQNLVYIRLNRGDLEGAREVGESAPEPLREAGLQWISMRMALAQRDWDQLREQLAPYLVADSDPTPGLPDVGEAVITFLSVTGRHREWFDLGRLALARVPSELVHEVEGTLLGATYGIAAEQPDFALSSLREIDRDLAFDGLPPEERFWQIRARTLARAGDLGGARAALEAFERYTPEWATSEHRNARTAYAELALAEGRPEAALALLREPHPDADWTRDTAAQRGRAFDALAQPDSAIAWWEVLADDRSAAAFLRVRRDLPMVLPRLADLHEAAGNAARARELRLEYLRMRSDPDPELRPRAEAVRRQMETAGG